MMGLLLRECRLMLSMALTKVVREGLFSWNRSPASQVGMCGQVCSQAPHSLLAVGSCHSLNRGLLQMRSGNLTRGAGVCSKAPPCECHRCRQLCCVDIILCRHGGGGAVALAGTLELQRDWAPVSTDREGGQQL